MVLVLALEAVTAGAMLFDLMSLTRKSGYRRQAGPRLLRRPSRNDSS